EDRAQAQRYQRAAKSILHAVVETVAGIEGRCLEGCTKTLNGIDIELGVGRRHELEDVLEAGLKLRLLRRPHGLPTPLQCHCFLVTGCDELRVRDALLVQSERLALPRLCRALPRVLRASLRPLLASVRLLQALLGPHRARMGGRRCTVRLALLHERGRSSR